MLTHKELKACALSNADVKAKYEKLGEELALLDQSLKAQVGRNEHSELRRMKSRRVTE
jgi:hypothetical protein